MWYLKRVAKVMQDEKREHQGTVFDQEGPALQQLFENEVRSVESVDA